MQGHPQRNDLNLALRNYGLHLLNCLLCLAATDPFGLLIFMKRNILLAYFRDREMEIFISVIHDPLFIFSVRKLLLYDPRSSQLPL